MHGSARLMSVNTSGEDLQALTSEGCVVGSFTFDRDQSKLAYFVGSLEDPARIVVRNLASGNDRLLTTHNRALLDKIDLGQDFLAVGHGFGDGRQYRGGEHLQHPKGIWRYPPPPPGKGIGNVLGVEISAHEHQAPIP
jgi:dipeptidyl aminopeptidase/acylaminoacyl peptidase